MFAKILTILLLNIVKKEEEKKKYKKKCINLKYNFYKATDFCKFTKESTKITRM